MLEDGRYSVNAVDREPVDREPSFEVADDERLCVLLNGDCIRAHNDRKVFEELEELNVDMRQEARSFPGLSGLLKGIG
jgi:hypothetical protein